MRRATIIRNPPTPRTICNPQISPIEIYDVLEPDGRSAPLRGFTDRKFVWAPPIRIPINYAYIYSVGRRPIGPMELRARRPFSQKWGFESGSIYIFSSDTMPIWRYDGRPDFRGPPFATITHARKHAAHQSQMTHPTRRERNSEQGRPPSATAVSPRCHFVD